MTLSTILTILAVILLTILLWKVWRLVQTPLPLEMQRALEEKTDRKMELLKEEWSRRLAEELERVWKQIQGQVQTTDRSVSQKLEEANRTFADVREQLGKLKQATEQVEAVGRNVASLHELLRAPKMRGGFGEFFLADLLMQIMPSDFYTLQYEFSSGERVDAVVRLGGRLVPVDAKFPLDQFRRMGEAVTDQERADWRKRLVQDVKIHIDAIAGKYIRPSEGTFDFALMYIPAENVYYETIIRDDGVSDEKGLFQHAIRRQVIPVSPNSFYGYLQVILLGLRGFAVEQRTREILGDLIRLQQEFIGLKEDFERTGKQLQYAMDNFNKAEKHLFRFEDRLEAIEAPPGSSDVLLPKSQESEKEPSPH